MQVHNHPYVALFGLSRLGGNSAPAPAQSRGTAPSAAAEDQVALSPEARQLAAEEEEGSGALSPQQELSEDEQKEVDKLKARDREVRAHEQAHKAAAGGYATSGPTYDYQSGPDGKRYAVGGEVGIDTSPISGDPEATIRKAQVIKRAAMAPAEPSGQDRRVAAQAGRMEAEARQELRQERMEESQASGAVGEAAKDDNELARPSGAGASSQAQSGAYGGISGFDRGADAAGQLLNLVA